MMKGKRTVSGCIPGPGPWCGTAGGYTNHDCRCVACTEAWRVYHRAFMNAKPERLAKHNARERVRYQRKQASA